MTNFIIWLSKRFFRVMFYTSGILFFTCTLVIGSILYSGIIFYILIAIVCFGWLVCVYGLHMLLGSTRRVWHKDRYYWTQTSNYCFSPYGNYWSERHYYTVFPWPDADNTPLFSERVK